MSTHRTDGNCNNAAAIVRFGALQEMWDVEDPQWRDKLHRWIRYGKHLPVRPMRVLERRFIDVPWIDFSIRRRSNNCFQRYYGEDSVLRASGNTTIDGRSVRVPTLSNTGWGSDAFPEFSEHHKNGILQKALANARTTSWDVGTFIAEFNKTSRMVRGVGRGVSRRVENILKKPSVKTLEDFSSAWLEYRYGWRILYYDIMEANESILRLRELNSLSNRYTAYEAASSVYTSDPYSYQRVTIWTGESSTGTPLRCDHHYQQELKTEIRAGVGLNMNTEKLGFADPLTTITEIIPYMLVVNWFVNIKEFVNAWSPFAHGSVAYGFVTETKTRQRTITTSNLRNVNTRYDTLVINRPNHATWIQREVVRTPKEPVMNLRFRLNLSPANLVDAVGMVLLSRDKVFRNLRPR